MITFGVTAFHLKNISQSASSVQSDIANQPEVLLKGPGSGIPVAKPEKVFLMGGINMGDVWYSNNLYTNNWYNATNSAPWGTSDYTPKSVFFNNKIWIIGGQQTTTGKVFSSVDGVTWQTVTSNAPWGARIFHTVLVFNDGSGDALWVIGGSNIGQNVSYNDVWKSYDGINWTQVTPHANWDTRNAHTSVVFNGKMWVIGGYRYNPTGGSSYLSDVWSSVDGINWVQATPLAAWALPGDPEDGRTYHTSVVFGGKMWVIGGTVRIPMGSTYMSDVWSSSDGVTWISATLTAPWLQRTWHTSFVYDNKMWVVAGFNSSSPSNNDVWYSSNGVNWLPANPLNAPWSARIRPAVVITPDSFGPKPDLVIDSISTINGGCAIAGTICWKQATVNDLSQAVPVDVTIKNIGTGPAIIPANMDLEVSLVYIPNPNASTGKHMTINSAATLLPGQTYTFHTNSSFGFNPIQLGQHALRAVVDFDNVVAAGPGLVLESNDMNNIGGNVPVTVVP